ncbi:MAG: queuosine precursor transporter [Anaerolineae bacterium]|nr:queuosine precursor transporter [Chloroflexota bacterium]
MAGFVAVLLVSNVASTKIVALGPLTFDGGTLLFPVSYIFGDVLTEVYGYARGRRVIHVGLLANLAMVAVLAAVGALPAAPGWEHQQAYLAILGTTPRIVAGSVAAYLAGSFSNAWVMARLKVRTAGRWLWLRTITSTLLGEAIDTALFVWIAFAGLLPPTLLWAVLGSNYAFKVGLEVLMTPVTYRVVNGLKRAEGVDHYDRHTDLSPFSTGL